MMAPTGTMINEALAQLNSPNAFAGEEWVRADQQKELAEIAPNASDAFKAGYELGLQTARVVLAGLPAAVINRVSF